MGYNTEFKGELRFTSELTASQLAKVKSFMGEDCREHPEWNTINLTWIDMELLEDFSGIKWNGGEKTYDLVEKVNLIIDQMRIDCPNFGLEGKLMAQGEDIDDRWMLLIENGRAIEKKILISGTKVRCPHCDEEFILEETEQ